MSAMGRTVKVWSIHRSWSSSPGTTGVGTSRRRRAGGSECGSRIDRCRIGWGGRSWPSASGWPGIPSPGRPTHGRPGAPRAAGAHSVRWSPSPVAAERSAGPPASGPVQDGKERAMILSGSIRAPIAFSPAQPGLEVRPLDRDVMVEHRPAELACRGIEKIEQLGPAVHGHRQLLTPEDAWRSPPGVPPDAASARRCVPSRTRRCRGGSTRRRALRVDGRQPSRRPRPTAASPRACR